MKTNWIKDKHSITTMKNRNLMRRKFWANLSGNMMFQQRFIGQALLWAIPGLVIQKITITFIFLARDFTTSKITKHKRLTKMTSQLARNAYINLRSEEHTSELQSPD